MADETTTGRRRHTEAISSLEALALDYERIAARREKAGADDADALLSGSRQVAAEVRESIHVLDIDLGTTQAGESLTDGQPRTTAVAVPSIPHGPAGVPTLVADADYYLEAARNIRWHASQGRAFAGSNVTETVALLCEATARALLAAHRDAGADHA